MGGATRRSISTAQMLAVALFVCGVEPKAAPGRDVATGALWVRVGETPDRI